MSTPEGEKGLVTGRDLREKRRLKVGCEGKNLGGIESQGGEMISHERKEFEMGTGRMTDSR